MIVHFFLQTNVHEPTIVWQTLTITWLLCLILLINLTYLLQKEIVTWCQISWSGWPVVIIIETCRESFSQEYCFSWAGFTLYWNYMSSAVTSCSRYHFELWSSYIFVVFLASSSKMHSPVSPPDHNSQKYPVFFNIMTSFWVLHAQIWQFCLLT